MPQYERLGDSNLTSESVIGAVIVGLGLGLVIVKGKVHLPSVILTNHFFAVFTTAVTTTLILQAFMAVAKWDRFEHSRFTTTKGNPISVGVGGFLLGIGVALCKSSPALAFIQLGTGMPNAGIIVLSGFAAALLYGFLYESFFVKLDDSLNDMKCLDEYFNVDYWIIALPMAVLFGSVMWLIGWKSSFEYSSVEDWIPDPRKGSWQPYLVGILIGLMQLPSISLVRQKISSLCAYLTPVSMTISQIAKSTNKNCPAYFRNHGVQGLLWQLIMMLTATATAALTAYSTNTMSSEKGVSFLESFGFGIIMYLGAFIAGGSIFEFCVSGLADLHAASYIGLGAFLLGSLAVKNMSKLEHQIKETFGQ